MLVSGSFFFSFSALSARGAFLGIFLLSAVSLSTSKNFSSSNDSEALSRQRRELKKSIRKAIIKKKGLVLLIKKRLIKAALDIKLEAQIVCV